MIAMRNWLLPALAALLLQGCGTFADPTTWFGAEDTAAEPLELEKIDALFSPRELWSRGTGGADNQESSLRPALAAGRVFVADSDGTVTAMEADTGKLLWEVDTELPISGGPGAGEGLVAFGTLEGDVVALDAIDGSERWRSAVTSEILSVPAIGGGRVVVHTLDGRIFGLGTDDGSLQWRHDREIPVLTLRGSSSPLILGGQVFVGSESGKLLALGLEEGELEWDINVSIPSGRSDLERMTDIDADPLYYGGALYAASYQGKVIAIGEASGKPFWGRDMSVFTNMAANFRQLAVVDADSQIWALDPDTGAAKWRQEGLMHRRLSGPAIQDGYIVVGDLEGYVHWLSPDDGAIVARTRVGGGPIAAPLLVRDETLYVYAADGELAAIVLPETP
jgi:outer membrane protein assembly factor BamB